jgi:ABC-type transport system substrate-binding protein
LTDYHPKTLEPVAALATRYETNSDFTRFIFYLRGHSKPRGLPLAGGPRDGLVNPARWSDGNIISAHDFVYSWRRAVNPANGFPTASLFYPIENAQAINSGKAKPETLGAHAVDDFALQVDLREPTPYFLQMVASNQFFPVPGRLSNRLEHPGLHLHPWSPVGLSVCGNGAEANLFSSTTRVTTLRPAVCSQNPTCV